MLPFHLSGSRFGRGHPWGVTRPDAWLAGAVAVATVGIVLAAPTAAPYRPVDALAVVLAVAGPLALLWRQVLPLAALAVAGLVIVANAAVGYAIGFLPWISYICLFTCFALGSRRVRSAAVAVAGLGAAGYLTFDRGDVDAELLSSIATAYLVAAIAGHATRGLLRTAATRAQLVDESRQQALTAERLLVQERGRLARELHDSLGHTVNVMVLQAGVGRRVFADNPSYSHEALATIETVGRGALDELDRLLRVLQPAERDGTREPFAPTIADLEELAGRIRATGRQVDLRTDGVELAASRARAVYRIIQEALTNAVRHTSTGRIAVDVSRAEGQIFLDVINEGCQFREPVPGRGLVNMRERARLEGGRLEAGPIDGAFRVRAILPVDSGAGA